MQTAAVVAVASAPQSAMVCQYINVAVGISQLGHVAQCKVMASVTAGQ